MMALFQAAFFTGVGVVVLVFGLLPLAVLLGICVLYLLSELVQRFFRHRGTWQNSAPS